MKLTRLLFHMDVHWSIHTLRGFLTLLFLIFAAIAGLFIWLSSSTFEQLARHRLIAQLEETTGGRVEIAAFHWHTIGLDAEADDVVIHGLEPTTEDPYVRVARLHANFTIFGLFTPRIHLRQLEVTKPAIHLLFNMDGSTNIPKPRRSHAADKTTLDEIFNLKVGHIIVSDGLIRINALRKLFDVDAHDLDLSLGYQPNTLSSEESYHLETALSDLSFRHGLNIDYTTAAKDAPVAHYRIQSILDLTRDSAFLRSFELVSNSHRLTAVGTLHDFTHPEWEAKFKGEYELALLQPLTGYQDTPAGIAHVDLLASGKAGDFRIDGPVHVDNGSYTGAGLYSAGVTLDTRAHADKNVMRFDNINLKIAQGGTITGEVVLHHWVVPSPGTPGYNVRPAGLDLPAMRSWDVFIPVDGVVNAQLNGITVDTLMEIVSPPAFHRLGLAGIINGPTKAEWTGGDIRTLRVDGRIAVSPSSNSIAGEVLTSGVIEGTYFQSNSSVDLRNFDLKLPQSHMVAHGKLGAYPLNSPSALNIDFSTSNFGEFDALLRDLDFERYNQRGASALPVQLRGQFNYKGTWGGSLLDPHMTGNATATQISIELPPRIPYDTHADTNSTDPNRQRQWLAWDSIEANGSYSATHVQLDSARLTSANRAVELSGSLDAVTGPFPPRDLPAPDFDAASNLHMRVTAHGIDINDIYSLAGKKLPITGALATQFECNGPLNALNGTGWVQLTNANAYGEPITRLHIHGDLSGSLINVTSLIVNAPAGSISAHGSYNYATENYTIDAHGAGLQLTHINALHSLSSWLSGSLNFTAVGTGSLSDPHLEAHASIDRFLIEHNSPNATAKQKAIKPGALIFSAYAANHTLAYDAQATIDSAEIIAHGTTAINADYSTQAQVNLSNFNLSTLFRLTHLEQLTASSAINGTFTLTGPLAHLDTMKGEANIDPLSANIQGVQLRSEHTIHATLAQKKIKLDPVHIIGDDTDLNVNGDLSLAGNHALNLDSSGAINLKLAETLDSDLTASGSTTFQVQAHGTLDNPGLTGNIDFQNGALSLEDLTNGLSQLHGRLEFNQNRLEVRNLTAMSGGGLLSLSGYLAYQNGIYADLAVTGKSIRIRYPQGVSSLGDTTLRLQGTPSNLLLSGNVLITRFNINPDIDLAALAAQSTSFRPIPPLDAPSNHIRLDVHIQSSPQLSFQNAFAKLAGNVDLRLRGTVANPSLLGRIVLTEGSATIAGTHYDLEHAEILFDNPVRIQPIINLNATAHVEDYDITLGIHGTFDKNAFTYRSEPPLPQADVIALLALGHTQEQQRLYTQQQESAISPTTDALLNGALNATVSNRVSKLFGAATVKVDPTYLGAQGTATSRVTVQEQIGHALTLTIATNANSTSQQLIQAEIAINHHVSLLVARDESGVFSMVLKATRRHR
jgi:translocation and assembly module TamB